MVNANEWETANKINSELIEASEKYAKFMYVAVYAAVYVCVYSYRYAKSQKQQQQQLTTATTRAIQQQQQRCSHCAHELVALAAITIKHACKYWIIKKGE